MAERTYRTLTTPNDHPNLLPKMPVMVRAEYDRRSDGCDLQINRLDSLRGSEIDFFSPGLMESPRAVFEHLSEYWSLEWPDKWAAQLRGDFANPLMSGGESDHGIYYPECFEEDYA